MRRIIVLLLIVFIGFVVWNRQRLFVRDPLANVVRNQVSEPGAQVYINFNSDVLIENDRAPAYVEVVAHDNHTGVPQKLHCIHYVACLLDEDVPTLLPMPGGISVELMNSKLVQFRDGKRETDVELF